MEKKFRSPAKQKFLLLLARGAEISFTYSPSKQIFLARKLAREWRQIPRAYLLRLIREFYIERLIKWQENKDGTITMILTEAGHKKLIRLDFDRLVIKKPKTWDGIWRVVFFDVPEKQRPIRDALRHKLRELGFHELQKSVFAYPFACQDEIDFVVEFFNARRFVRHGELKKLTNEAELKLHFNLV